MDYNNCLIVYWRKNNPRIARQQLADTSIIST